jgi:NADH-quinone oxidoreductase subunit M
MKRGLFLKWVVFAHNHQNRFDVLAFSLASVALPTTLTSLESFNYISFSNQCFAFLGGTTIILGAYYMLKMYQQVMLGETNTKVFADVTLMKDLLWFLSSLYYSFRNVSKTITDLITPSLRRF